MTFDIKIGEVTSTPVLVYDRVYHLGASLPAIYRSRQTASVARFVLPTISSQYMAAAVVATTAA